VSEEFSVGETAATAQVLRRKPPRWFLKKRRDMQVLALARRFGQISAAA
jgi:hypothetical protein